MTFFKTLLKKKKFQVLKIFSATLSQHPGFKIDFCISGTRSRPPDLRAVTASGINYSYLP